MACLDNTVLIGKKYFMRYVAAILYKLFVEGCRSVKLRALGKNISRAVHIANSTISLVKELSIAYVGIGTLSLISEGKRRSVSCIEIELRIRDYIP